jgi:hypothetical protein
MSVISPTLRPGVRPLTTLRSDVLYLAYTVSWCPLSHLHCVLMSIISLHCVLVSFISPTLQPGVRYLPTLRPGVRYLPALRPDVRPLTYTTF